jgi:DNA-binding MarR family transcriptional regulator
LPLVYDWHMSQVRRSARGTASARSRAAAPPAGPNGRAGAPEDAALVLRQFRQIFRAVKSHFQQVERRAGVGGAQVWALSVIASRPGLVVGDLAQAMDVHQTTASNLVRGLLDAGLIEAERSPEDRRRVSLHALPAGHRILRKAPGPSSGVLPLALSQLDPATLKRLGADLGQLTARLEVEERAGRLPLADL